MNIAMYKSNREKKDKSFWGKKDLFYNSVEFDKTKAIEYFHTLKLTESEKCEFIEQFINFYLPYKFNDNNQYWFNKSVEFIEEVSGISIQVIYKLAIEQIGQFTQKEDFEIFYYFKCLDILQDGHNNIFSELLNWFSYHENRIQELLENTNEETNLPLSDFLFMATRGVGKSLYVKQQLLNENCVVISQKDIKLKQLNEEDKSYFYDLFLNLTTQTNLSSFLQKIQINKNDFELKGIAKYIEKRINFEVLTEKMAYKTDKKSQNKGKVLKI